MTISAVTRLSGSAVPVIVLCEGMPIAQHPLFRGLAADDRTFLTSFLSKTPLKSGHNHLVFLPSRSRVALIGAVAKDKFTHRAALLLARRVIWYARREKLSSLALSLDDFTARAGTPRPDRATLATIIATQCAVANFEFTKYRVTPADGWSFVSQLDVVVSSGERQRTSRALARGAVIGEEMNAMRALANTPGGDMTPDKLAAAAKTIAVRTGCEFEVLGVKEMEKLGMGGVLGVGKGSAIPPRFIVLTYRGAGKREPPTALVGKGVTFDTGGLNLKPEQGIYEMHMDMTGGAAVLHTVAALARLKAKENVIALVPAAENMPSGSSYRPGDVLTSMSGKTIEVLNTDAEGRIILADALTYAKRFNPRLTIDVATLTGASMVALGQRASALFTTDRTLETKLRALGELTGDFVWPLPLWEEYEEDVRGTFADVANMGKTRYGGAITGAVFLWQFVKNGEAQSAESKSPGAKRLALRDQPVPWVHLDIAPRMTSIEGDFLAKGSAGAGVALLVHLLATSH